MLIHVVIMLIFLYGSYYSAPFFSSFSTSPVSSFIPVLSLYLYCVRHHFSQAAVSVKVSNLLICFCSFDLSNSKGN